MQFPSLSGWGVLTLLFASVPNPARAQSRGKPTSVALPPETVVRAALDHHPAIMDAEAYLALARAKRSQASLLMQNPTAAAYSSVDGTALELGLSQPVSLTGEGLYARSAGAAGVEAAKLNLRRTQLVVAAGALNLYVDALVAIEHAKLADEAVVLSTRLSRAVTRQYEEGEATLLAVRLVRLQAGRTASDLLAAREEEAIALADLSGMVGQRLGPENLVGTAEQVAVIGDNSLTAPDVRLDVQAATSTMKAARRELSRQRAAALPRVGVGVRLEREGENTTVGPDLSVEVPLFNRNQVGRAESTAAHDSAMSTLALAEARAATEIATAQARFAEATKLRGDMSADLIADARAALESIEAGYLAGEIDLSSAVLLQAQVIDGERAAIELAGRMARTRIDLLLALDQPSLLAGGAP